MPGSSTSPELPRLVAHEYFHALHYWLDPGEEDWVREGMAQVFEIFVVGRPNGKHLMAAQKFPSAPLVGAFDYGNDNSTRYGQALLYFSWLTRECGGRELFWDLLRPVDGLKGLKKIDTVLRKRGGLRPQCRSARQSVLDFQMAKVHNRVDFYKWDNPLRYFLGNYRFVKFAPSADPMVATSVYRLTPRQAERLREGCPDCHIFCRWGGGFTDSSDRSSRRIPCGAPFRGLAARHFAFEAVNPGVFLTKGCHKGISHCVLNYIHEVCLDLEGRFLLEFRGLP